MLILGISSFTSDTAAALLRDGAVVAAIENHKLQPSSTLTQRIPEAAIQFCLETAKVSWDDLDVVAVASNPSQGWGSRVVSSSSLSPSAPFATVYQEGKELARFAREWSCIRSLRQRGSNSTEIVSLDHHLCHASSAFFLSPFDKALILTLDGEGDGKAGVIALGDGNKITPLESIAMSDSVGRVYSRITNTLGFIPSKEEHKTQWLSLEGEPVYEKFFLRILRRPGKVLPGVDGRYFRRGSNGMFAPSDVFWKELGIDGDVSTLSPELKRNLASSLQAAITKLISDLLGAYQKKAGTQHICLSGGVFHNSLLVAALEQKFGIGNIFVPPAPGNAGSAIGAAFSIWHQQNNKPRTVEIRSVYFGPSYARTEIKDVLDNVKARYNLQNTWERKFESAVKLLRAGKIVGWFHGATEFGPRALGHRSILASPWAPYVTENLNDFVKHRESFRPFAVSVRQEDCDRYFIGSPLCRFMNSLASVRPGIDVLPPSLLLPGGLVRLHIVEKETDPILWELLGRFGQEEPAPLLVNTSFNLPGEPPVIRPKDAVRTFFCSGIDAVFIDNFLLTKSGAAHVLNERPGPDAEANAAAQPS